MSVSQLEKLAERGYLGAHAHDHLALATLDAGQQQYQLQRCLDLLESWTRIRPVMASYPYGGRSACSTDVAEVAEDKGIVFAFTMERSVNETLRSPQLLARYDCNDVPERTRNFQLICSSKKRLGEAGI